MDKLQVNEEKKPKLKDYIFLHVMLLMYSAGGIFSKLASAQEFLSPLFILLYGIVILNLGVYAILWQQILKKFPLTTAFANKAVTVVWGMLWGLLFFKEQITVSMIIGAAIIIFGIYLVVTGDE